MKLHFKPTGEHLDTLSIRGALPLALGANGIFEDVVYEELDDGTLIADIKGTTETTKDSIIELCQASLNSWGDMTFDVIED